MNTEKPKLPYRLGKEAFVAGSPRSDCPFPEHSDDARKWGLGWSNEEIDAIVAKAPKPDFSLIAEAENLIPKGPFYCGHELNRMLHWYREVCRKGDPREMHITEIYFRKGIVRARLEAAGLPQSKQPMNSSQPNTPSALDKDRVITKGDDAGKTVGELHTEVLDPNVLDEEYFQRRRRHFQSKAAALTNSNK